MDQIIAKLKHAFFFSFKVVETRLGTLIHGQLDQLERGVLFTDAFVARQMACIRGVFSAITKYIFLFLFYFISFANLILNIHKQNKKCK